MMKVENNMTIYAGARPADETVSGQEKGKESGNEKGNRRTVFAGDLNMDPSLQDRIRQRKEQARQEAMKIVRDTWDNAREVERELDGSRERISRLQEDSMQVQERLRDIGQKKQELGEIYGVTEDTPEEAWPQEYRDRIKELNDYEDYNERALAKNQQGVMAENAAIRGVRREMRKKAPMIAAEKEAEQKLAAADDEIMGMVVDEAKEYQEEKQTKREEQAEKLKEKKEETEELRKKREEGQSLPEELAEEVPVEEVLELDRSEDDMRREVQSIMDKMKLAAEDLKGAMVDTVI